MAASTTTHEPYHGSLTGPTPIATERLLPSGGISKERDLFAPPGQVVMGWAPGIAQLGLDGRSYAVPQPAPDGGSGAEPLTSEASPQLGPQHDLFARASKPAKPKRNWWELKRALTSAFAAAAEEREDAKLRAERVAKCRVTRIGRQGSEVDLHRSESGRWDVAGVVRCGQWGCPICGPSRARETTSVVGASFVQHLDCIEPGRDVWMLTLTLWHTAEEAMAAKVGRLYEAAGAFFASKAWRAWKARFGVVAVVRFYDNTAGGQHGLHPHFHVALYPTQALVIDDGGVTGVRQLDEERRNVTLDLWCKELVPAWEAAVKETGVWPTDAATVDAFREHGLQLQGSERAAAYFAKWGLAEEVGMSPVKRASHFDVLELAAFGDKASGDWFVAWFLATKGRAFVVGLELMRRAIGLTDEMVEAYATAQRERREKELAEAGQLPLPVAALKVRVRSWLYRAALDVGWSRVFEVADQADEAKACPQAAVDAFLLAHERERLRRPRRRTERVEVFDEGGCHAQ